MKYDTVSIEPASLSTSKQDTNELNNTQTTMSLKQRLLFEDGEDISDIDIKANIKLENEFDPLIDIEQSEINPLSIKEEVSGDNDYTAAQIKKEFELLDYIEPSEVNLLSIKEEVSGDNDYTAAQTETEYESLDYIEQSEVNSLSIKKEVLGDNENTIVQTETEYEPLIYIEQSEVNSLSIEVEVLGDIDNSAAQTEIEHCIPQTNRKANNVLGDSSYAVEEQILVEVQPSGNVKALHKEQGSQSVIAIVKNTEDALKVEAAELIEDRNKEQESLSVYKPIKTYNRIKHQVKQTNKTYSRIEHQAYMEQSEVKTDVHINLPGSSSMDNDGNITSIAVIKPNQPNTPSDFACFSCSFTTSILGKFIEHSYTHPGGKDPHVCKICWSRFSQADHLRLHLQIHPKKELSMNNEHMNTDSTDDDDENIDSTDHDDENTDSTDHDDENTDDITIVSAFACLSCSFTTSIVDKFIEHLFNHTTEDNPYTCKVCGSRFSEADHLRLHSQTHTKKKLGMDADFKHRVYFACRTCSFKTLVKNKLFDHLKSHVTCVLCGSMFECASDLCGHTNNYKCGMCRRILNSKCSLTKHLSIHLRKKLYKCGLCDKMYKQNKQFQAHIQHHPGQQTYTCQVCGRRRLRVDLYRDHLQCHTKEEYERTPFGCVVCLNRYHLYSSLRGHLQTHTAKKLHECELCEKRFNLKCMHKINISLIGYSNAKKSQHRGIGRDGRWVKTQSAQVGFNRAKRV